MVKWKSLKHYLFLLSVFLLSLFFIQKSPSVNAQSYGNSATYPVTSCVHTVGPVGNVQKYVQGVTYNQGCSMIQSGQTGGVSGQVNSMSIVFQNQIPGPAIVSFDINIYGGNLYNGFIPSGSNWALLNEEVTRYTDNNNTVWNIHYTWYIKNSTNNLALGNYLTYIGGNSRIDVTGATVILLYDPVSAQDIQQLKDRLQSIDQNVVIGDQRLQYILDEIRAQDEKEEQEKQEQEQQGTDSQNDSNQAGNDVSGATTNLMSAITGFFGAFTSATATTCQTDWGIEGFRNFDFCATQIPTELRIVFTIVASIIFIPMIWFLITSILNAFKEFQE